MLDLVQARRLPVRRLPSRRDGAPRARARRVPRAESAPRLRAHDRVRARTGPLAQAAGHDINYIALAGALAPIGRGGEAPLPPLNLVGDFGGGGTAARVRDGLRAPRAQARSGKGQVVDAAMVDGAAVLMTMFHGMRQIGMWSDERAREPARHRRALLRRVRDARTASTSRSARSSRSSTRSSSSSRASMPAALPRADGQGALARS